MLPAPLKTVALAVPAAAIALSASPARGDPASDLGLHLDADVDLGSPMGAPESRLSFGAGGRLGFRVDLGRVWLQPEAGGSYTGFAVYDPYHCPACPLIPTKHPVRVFGGLRIGGAGLIAGAISPALFAHAGCGWFEAGVLVRDPDTGTVSIKTVERRGPALDVGFALDVDVVRHLRFGVHGAYNVVTGPRTSYADEAVKWISYGLHVGAAL